MTTNLDRPHTCCGKRLQFLRYSTARTSDGVAVHSCLWRCPECETIRAIPYQWIGDSGGESPESSCKRGGAGLD